MEKKFANLLSNLADIYYEDHTGYISRQKITLGDYESFEQMVNEMVIVDAENDKNILKLAKTKEDFYKWIQSQLKFEHLLSQIYQYIHINDLESPKDINKNGPLFEKMMEKISEVEYSAIQIIAKNKAKILKFLKDPKLQIYSRWINANYLRYSEHELNKKEHGILSTLKAQCGTLDELFKLTFGGVELPPLKEPNYPSTTNKEYADWIKQWRQKVENLYHCFPLVHEYIKMKICDGLQEAQLKKFKSRFEMMMHELEISGEIAQNILQSCKPYSDEIKRFVDWKDTIVLACMQKSKLYPWDRVKDVIQDKPNRISKQQAQQDILNALSILGPRYVKLVKEIFDNKLIKWNHASDNTNFSLGGKAETKHPIYVNFEGKIDNVITLAHEIGHSIASELSIKQGVYSGINPLHSEIPSFVNEMLMILYYLRTKYTSGEEERIIVYNTLNRLFDVLADYPFCVICPNKIEEIVIKNLQAKEMNIFSWDDLFNAYIKTKLDLGMLNKNDEQWLSSDSALRYYDLGHIFEIYSVINNPKFIFYYLGATVGFCIALLIANKGGQIIKDYLKYLESGSLKDPIEALKKLGFNITKLDPRPIMSVYHEMMDKLEELTMPKPKKTLKFNKKTSGYITTKHIKL